MTYPDYLHLCSLAEARHRAELKRNRDYQYFMLQLSQDPRVRKHDLATFLSRPVTRLPRLALVLEHLHKLAEPGSDDHESLPLTLNILSDFIKSTQPGIEAADLKAKFWELAESLVFVRGEMIVSGHCLIFSFVVLSFLSFSGCLFEKEPTTNDVE
jgi:hypothetical protein